MKRRDLIAWPVTAVLARLSAAFARGATATPFPWASLPRSVEKRSEFLYRVDATILLLGVPVVRRSAVGEARMAMRQSRNAVARRIALEFAASSDPARAHGLDRLGWIRELALEEAGLLHSATVLGIMSDSPEQSAAEARQSFAPASQKRFVAIDSFHEQGETRSRTARFVRPGLQPLAAATADAARTSLAESRPPWRHTSRGGVAAPFLYSILRAMESDKAVVEGSYVYNEDEYRLRLERKGDGKAGEHVRGQLRNASKRLRPLHFRFWTEKGAGPSLPTRIEFQPRSFLQLRMERISASPSICAQALAAAKETQ